MEAVFQLKWDLNRKNTTLICPKSMKRKTLILLPILSTTFIIRFTMKVSIIITTTRPSRVSSIHHHLAQKFLIPMLQTATTSNLKSILSMTCTLRIGSLALQALIFSFSICQITWRTHNSITFSEDSEIFIQQEWWQRRTENLKVSGL